MNGFPNSGLLYIIGNGFDLHHRIPSSYSDFGRYVQGIDSSLHSLFDHCFSFEGNWADFENTLAHLDVDLILDEAATYLVPYSAEDWSDAYHHDYQYEIDRIVSSLSEGLKRRFTEWVCTLGIPKPSSCQVPLLGLDLGAKYLTFNYTNTLQKLYGIDPAHIFHIHNQAVGLESDLVLGHGVSPKSIPSLNVGADLEDQDTRITWANESIDNYFSKTYKPSDRVIATHRSFFGSLSQICSIHVLGHSFSEVDMPYFQLLVQSIPTCPNWTVSFHDESKIPNLMNAFSQLGVRDIKVKYVRLADISQNT